MLLTCNKVPARLQDINYEYYIEQANKLTLKGDLSTSVEINEDSDE